MILPFIFLGQDLKKDFRQEYKKNKMIDKTILSAGASINSYYNSLDDGSSPYDNYFGSGVYDNSSYNEVTFLNTNSTDVIVCLENVSSGRTIRNEYIQKGNSFKMTKVPNGTYMVKVFYGNDWDPHKNILGGRIKGSFTKDENFTKSDKADDFLLMNQENTRDGVTYSVWSVTLYSVVNGNMDQRPINASSFFN